MIIQCEQCNTKFRLDDSKVKDKGVKVRCAKCKHVFTVKKDQPDTEAQPDFGTMFDQAASLGQDEPSDAGEETLALFSPTEESPVPEPEPSPAFDSSIFGLDDDSKSTISMNTLPPDLPENEPAPVSAPSDDDFSLSSLEDDQGFALEQEQTKTDAGELDFSGFDFGDTAEDADKTVVAAAPAPDFGEMTMVRPQTPAAAEQEESDSFDFGGEDMFGDVVAESTPEEPSEPIKFDFQMDEFADSMGVDVDTGETGKSEQAGTMSEEPFSLGEIDFGDELSSVAVQQVHPDELKPGQELLFAPLAEAQQKPASVELDTLTQAAQDELPPLSISSRRKQSPLYTGIIAAIAVVVVAVLAFFGYSMFSEEKGKAAADAGRITVRAVDAFFVKNKGIGDLLVITGEAVNEFAKPRAAIQIKGMVYDANDKVMASKTAYCGNPLTKEQLATMPLDKIDAAMTNQFGDSLANMEVAPGKSIPFVIVIAKPPAEGKDYGVEPAGSTVATGKQ